MSRLSEELKLRFTPAIMTKLKAKAEEEGVAVAELGREIITNYLQNEDIKEVLPEIRDAVRQAIKKDIDRLAGLCVHAGIAAGTAAWLSRSVLKQLTELDIEEVWPEAVARSKNNLKCGTMLEAGEEG